MTLTITSGESLTEGTGLRGNSLVGIQFGADWTAANITFEASADGITYGNLYNTDGDEVTVTMPTFSANMVVTFGTNLLPDLAKMKYLKIRSGTSGSAVNQGADRTLKLITSSF